MKPLILAIALLSPLAQAATIAVAETQADGWIYITDQRSDSCGKNEMLAKLENPGNPAVDGCWTPIDMAHIIVHWKSGRTVVYPISGFSKPEVAPRKDI